MPVTFRVSGKKKCSHHTVQCLDPFHIILRKAESIGILVLVSWVHQCRWVCGMGQTQGMAKFMSGNSK